jgi:hypothetical protein
LATGKEKKMKVRTHFFAAVVPVLLLVMINSVVAQRKPQMTPAEILAALKLGLWVKLEGVVQKDFSVLCKKVKILTGDFHEAEWSITAPPRSIDRAKKEFKVLLLPVKTQEDTQYKAKRSIAGIFNSFADLKEGMLMEVDGTYQKDGTFLAVEIEDKSADLIEEPGLQNEVEAVGRVERINVAKRTVMLMGIIFQLTDKTEGEHAFK